jgi:hypothetical protein
MPSIALSFYALGPRFHGIIGVAAHLLIQDAQPALIKEGTFQINYAEERAAAQTRFSGWLERIVVEGLNQWRKTL